MRREENIHEKIGKRITIDIALGSTICISASILHTVPVITPLESYNDECTKIA